MPEIAREKKTNLFLLHNYAGLYLIYCPHAQHF